MTNTSTTNLLKAYRLAITKKETTIADLLEKVIISEIHRNDFFGCDPLQSPSILPSILPSMPTIITTKAESGTNLTDDVLHTT